MATQSFLNQRVDATTWPIAIGDLTALLVFLFLGTLEHWTLEQIQADPIIYVYAALPFILGWLICAPLIGAYSPGGGSAPNSSIPLAIRSWIPAVIIGLIIRVIAIPDRGFDPVFALVIFIGGTVFLTAWRYIYFKLR